MTLAQLYARLLPLVGDRPHEEACGLLFGPPQPVPTSITSLEITGIQPVPNLAIRPSVKFEIDPAVVRQAWRRPDLLGLYHSHVTGPAIASRADRSLVQEGLLSVIIAPHIEMRIYGRHDGRMIELARWRPHEAA